MSRAFVEQWLDAVARGDIDALVTMCTPDVEISNPLGSFRGRDQLATYFKPLMDAFSERAYPITKFIESGDTIVVEFTDSARHTGPLPTPQGVVPATGRAVSVPVMAVYELRDGRLAHSRAQYNVLAYMQQLGLMQHAAPTAAASAP